MKCFKICNWFANWRRKLKNAGREPQKKTWGHLIKNYNTSANGNVEQFSICSADSIWGDEERATGLIYDHHHHMMMHMDSSSTPIPSSDYNGYHGGGGGGFEAGYSNTEYYAHNNELAGTKRNTDTDCDKDKTRYYTAGPSDGVMIEQSYGPKLAVTNAQEQCFQVSQNPTNVCNCE